jgi:MEMO1 family protein
MTTRPAAVAGFFYPQEKNQLIQQINSFFAQVAANNKGTSSSPNRDKGRESQFSKSDTASNLNNTQKPIALIVPHAGYIYSGLTAAHAFQQIIQYKDLIKRIILLGPAHRFYFHGMAAPNVSSFTTPLGEVPLDTDEIAYLQQKYQLLISNQPHDEEHCLEVQLPFLQTIIDNFKLVPIVVGECNIEPISNLLNRYINQPENLIIISTDLSHFMEYSLAQLRDQKTRNKIMHFKYDELEFNDACGRTPLAGLLHLANEKQLSIKQLDMRNSGDTAGDKDRVVGYGAWSLYEKE